MQASVHQAASLWQVPVSRPATHLWYVHPAGNLMLSTTKAILDEAFPPSLSASNGRYSITCRASAVSVIGTTSGWRSQAIDIPFNDLVAVRVVPYQPWSLSKWLPPAGRVASALSGSAGLLAVVSAAFAWHRAQTADDVKKAVPIFVFGYWFLSSARRSWNSHEDPPTHCTVDVETTDKTVHVVLPAGRRLDAIVLAITEKIAMRGEPDAPSEPVT